MGFSDPRVETVQIDFQVGFPVDCRFHLPYYDINQHVGKRLHAQGQFHSVVHSSRLLGLLFMEFQESDSLLTNELDRYFVDDFIRPGILACLR